MSDQLTTVEKLRGLRWAWAGNSANSISAQFTFFGSAFILFVSALGLNKTQIGLVLSLMPFAGLIALVVSPAVARFGYKRTFLTFWSLRKVAAAFLLLTPWVLNSLGFEATFTFIIIVISLFALCRATGETGYYPWSQEFVPTSVRGKYSATSNIFTTLAGLVAVLVAGLIIERSSGLNGYLTLIAIGVGAGVISVAFYSRIPGGAPTTEETPGGAGRRGLVDAFRDRGFLSFLAGVGLVTLATVPMVSFLPLFMQEQVGLSAGNVVLLQNGTLLGSLLSSYLWGWAADRYGSKPVMLSGVVMRVFLPVSWMLMPRLSPWSLPIALGIAVVQGVSDMSWSIGSMRFLFVSGVPADKKSDYMAAYYAWVGLVGGVSQLLGGRILDLSQGVGGQVLGFSVDPYFPLFLIGLTFPLVSWLAFQITSDDSDVGVGEFAFIFLRGNPFQAMGSMIRYYRARDEHTAVAVTEQLSRARSRLTVDELLEALADPRFHVRFEAIISIARTRSDPRLTEALIELLEGTEISLSVVAAWALGRIGDESGRDSLRRALDSPYRSLQAHSARALGALGDHEIAPLLLKRLPQETDKGLQMALAAALGQLQYAEAVEPLMNLLMETENPGAREELAFSLARIVGDERGFVSLLRGVRREAGTATSQAVSSLGRKWRKAHFDDGKQLAGAVATAADALSRGKLELGAEHVARIIRLLPEDRLREPGTLMLNACAQQLEELGAGRIEYLVLALHVLKVEPTAGAG